MFRRRFEFHSQVKTRCLLWSEKCPWALVWAHVIHAQLVKLSCWGDKWAQNRFHAPSLFVFLHLVIVLSVLDQNMHLYSYENFQDSLTPWAPFFFFLFPDFILWQAAADFTFPTLSDLLFQLRVSPDLPGSFQKYRRQDKWRWNQNSGDKDVSSRSPYRLFVSACAAEKRPLLLAPNRSWADTWARGHRCWW